MNKKKYFQVTMSLLILIVVMISHSEANVIPKQKPTSKKIQNLSNNITPIKKPSKVNNINSNTKTNITKKNNNLLPKKKPIIFKIVKKEALKKSKYYSKKDFAIAKKTITFIEKRDWNKALKTAKKARDKSILKFVQWKYLLTNGNSAGYYDYLTFIKTNPHFPRINRLKYLSEHKMSTEKISYKKIINKYSNEKPLSGYGELILGESKILNDENDEGIKLIKKGWITAKLSKRDIKHFRKKYKKYLKSEDYINRADWHAWENKYWDLQRILRYLPKGYQELYLARQLLMTRSYGVDAAIKKVPAKFKKDSGLQFDRLKWRRKRGRLDATVEILLEIKNTKEYLVRPDVWWKERLIASRSLIYKKNMN